MGRLCADVFRDGSQDKLLDITDEIGARLEYFQELEHATRMLNHPGESLVLQTDFLYMVERVDICIEYLKAHVRSFTLPHRRANVKHSISSDITGRRRSTCYASSNA